VDIDGTIVALSGDRKICPTITKHYALKAVGPGGTATRNVSITVASVAPTQTPSLSGFNTGDVIKIGYDVFVIANGERHHVPNPDTLDALGISQSWVDNKGWTAEQLMGIPRGADIPDVNKDKVGFDAFKSTYFPSTTPIVPQVTSVPISQPTPVMLQPTQNIASEDPFWCDWWVIGDLFCQNATEVQASTNTNCWPQCVTEAHSMRPDIREWPSGGTTERILAKAMSMPIFKHGGSEMQVKVRTSDETPEKGDLVVWESGCDNAWRNGGHIGYVQDSRPGYITIHDTNWDNKCSTRNKFEIEILSCMSFITSPYPAQKLITYQPVDECSQYEGFRWILCKWFGWK
jgi:hypothetical protein